MWLSQYRDAIRFTVTLTCLYDVVIYGIYVHCTYMGRYISMYATYYLDVETLRI